MRDKKYKLRHLFDLQGGLCYICDAAMNLANRASGHQLNDASLDHVLAKALGGSDEISNLKACCRGCNAKKDSAATGALEEKRREKYGITNSMATPSKRMHP